MDLNKKISLGKEAYQYIKKHIKEIWPGFEAVPFILYDDENQAAFGTVCPKNFTQAEDGVWTKEGFDSALMGNTSINYHDLDIAIWNTRTWPEDVSISRAAAGIAHEMFHAFQGKKFSIPWANELLQPDYPHSKESIAIVMEENKLLLETIKNQEKIFIKECIKKIIILREERLKLLGEKYLNYDLSCESIEGTAAYVELNMKAKIEGNNIYAGGDKYFSALENEDKLLLNYRHRCYTSGLVLCLACTLLFENWEFEWMKSGKTIFDWIKEKIIITDEEKTLYNNSIEADIDTAEKLLGKFTEFKENKIKEFLNQNHKILEGEIELTGFDPMNLICSNKRCLHNMGKLKINGEEQFITKPFLEEYGETIFDLKRILISN